MNTNPSLTTDDINRFKTHLTDCCNYVEMMKSHEAYQGAHGVIIRNRLISSIDYLYNRDDSESDVIVSLINRIRNRSDTGIAFNKKREHEVGALLKKLGIKLDIKISEGFIYFNIERNRVILSLPLVVEQYKEFKAGSPLLHDAICVAVKHKHAQNTNTSEIINQIQNYLIEKSRPDLAFEIQSY